MLLAVIAAIALKVWTTLDPGLHDYLYGYLLGDEDCRWVMGNVERKTDRFERTTRIEDAAVAVFEFERGARALILADVTPTLFQGAHIYGTEGLINLTTEELQLLNAETGGVWRARAARCG